LDDTPPDRDVRLRVEATLREIDAGFATADLTEPLRSVRARLAAAVSS
jgi:MoxR-like ATPase